MKNFAVKPDAKKNKEDADYDYYLMMCNSWSWQMLTPHERSMIGHILANAKLYGNYDQRKEQCKQLVTAFMTAIGYDPISNRFPKGWRENNSDDTPQF